jgi:hypothetical protein
VYHGWPCCQHNLEDRDLLPAGALKATALLPGPSMFAAEKAAETPLASTSNVVPL